MSKKRALIVDDSKSARVVLGRMLQKYDIEVETAESAETAIEHLRHNRPDVIFMDHLMPGMDGFQAVQAIKNNPDTATIPIMMYTSQQGELYVGQARALGAVGVLPKLVKPVDVSKVLYQLHLLPDRRDAAPPAFIDANPAATSGRSGSAETLLTESQVIAGLVPADWHPQLESALRNHDAELRRFVVANLDSCGDRIIGRVNEDVRNLLAETSALQNPSNLPNRVTAMWVAALLLALVPGIVFGVFYLRSLEYNHQLSAAAARLEERSAQLNAQVQRMSERETTQAQLLVGAVGGSAGDEANGAAALPAGQAPVSGSFVETVPYGEVPLAMTRVDTMRELLDRLREQSFKGQVHIETFSGKFCLKGNSTEGYAPAPATLPAAECDLVGNPHEESLSPAQHESMTFANLRSSVRQRVGEGLTVDIALNGEKVAVPYPRSRNTVTAGQWNEIAARNNRVEFRAIPTP